MTPEERAEAKAAIAAFERDGHIVYEWGDALLKAIDALDAAERERDEAIAQYSAGLGHVGAALDERDTARSQVATLAEALRYYAKSPNDGRTRLESVPMIDFVGDSAVARAALKAAGVEL